jgi:hypothetical protein
MQERKSERERDCSVFSKDSVTEKPSTTESRILYPERKSISPNGKNNAQACPANLTNRMIDKLRWKMKYAEDEDRSKPLSERFRERVVLTKPEGHTVELEWSEAKQNKKDAQKSAAEIGLAYVQQQPITANTGRGGENRSFEVADIKWLLDKIAMDDKCMTVILLQDFFGTLTGNDREVERLLGKCK